MFLKSLPGHQLSDCLRQCRSYPGCYYGTFVPDMNLCLLYQTCSRANLETDVCPLCITSSIECDDHSLAGELKQL